MAFLGASPLLLGWVLGFTGARNTCFKTDTTSPPRPQPHEALGPELRGREEGVGSRARQGESQGVTGAAAAAAPASHFGSRDKVFFFSGFFWRWGGDSGAPTGPMQAAVVDRLATGGANGRRLACGACDAGAEWEPCKPAEPGRLQRGERRSPAGGGEGGSWRWRRGRRPGRCVPRRLCGPSGRREQV